MAADTAERALGDPELRRTTGLPTQIVAERSRSHSPDGGSPAGAVDMVNIDAGHARPRGRGIRHGRGRSRRTGGLRLRAGTAARYASVACARRGRTTCRLLPQRTRRPAPLLRAWRGAVCSIPLDR